MSVGVESVGVGDSIYTINIRCSACGCKAKIEVTDGYVAQHGIAGIEALVSEYGPALLTRNFPEIICDHLSEKEDNMSWVAFTSNDPIDRNGELPLPPGGLESLSDSTREQYEQAIRAVRALAPVIGRPEDKITVNMSGHGNPDHAPHMGSGDEFITISVYARPEKQ